MRPSDVKALAHADVVLRSGGDVDDWLDSALDSAGVDAHDVVDARRGAGLDGDDPHWWQDPRAPSAPWRRSATRSPADAGAAGRRQRRRYERAPARARRGRRRLHGRACPPAERTLVTSHDALGYYARRYGISVIGTVIPSLSTAGPAVRRRRREARATRSGARACKTIFAESSVNPKVEQAIAREAGARVGTALWADSLGPRGLRRRDLHRLDRGQHRARWSTASAAVRSTAASMPDLRRPTSSAGSSRSCCSP